jgi:hypothetical protein
MSSADQGYADDASNLALLYFWSSSKTGQYCFGS